MKCPCGQEHGKYWSTSEVALHDAYMAHRRRRTPIKGCNCRACKDAA